VFAGKKSAQIREILISESAWEEMTCLFAPSLDVTTETTLLLRYIMRRMAHQNIAKRKRHFLATGRFLLMENM
jgi:hypothetical protein